MNTVIIICLLGSLLTILFLCRLADYRKWLDRENQKRRQAEFDKRMAKQERAIRKYQHACGCSEEEAHARWCEKCAGKWAAGCPKTAVLYEGSER